MNNILSLLALLSILCLPTAVHSACSTPMDTAKASLVAPSNTNRTSNGRSTTVNSFTLWYNRCKTLPRYNEYTGITKQVVDLPAVLQAHQVLVDMMHNTLRDPAVWLPTPNMPDVKTYFIENPAHPCAFVQKLIVPSGSTIAVHGDLHGDIHSLNEYLAYLQSHQYLRGFKIVRPDFYIIFLGDYTDKGLYGLEVLFTLMQLKIANPAQVHLIRGNHEDRAQNKDQGFFLELTRKFGPYLAKKDIKLILNYFSYLYNCMPVALYLGSGTPGAYDFIQCCHGGMELGYNPRELLSSLGTSTNQFLVTLERTKENSILTEPLNTDFHDVKLIESGTYADIGFMWSDFIVDPEIPIRPSDRGKSIYDYGKIATTQILKSGSSINHTVRGVFRGHQHSSDWDPLMEIILDRYNKNPDNKGVGKLWQDATTKNLKLWDGIVCTFLVSPGTPYGLPDHATGYPGFSYDAFGILKTADTFDQWDLTMHYTGR